MSEKKYKHIRKEQREIIEDRLNAGVCIAEIAREIGASPATVMREVMRNRRDDGYRTSVWRSNNRCARRRDCDRRGVCGRCSDRKCTLCKYSRCNAACDEYTEDICIRISGVPHVCNGCKKNSNCVMHRYRYSAKDAQTVADSRAVESRSGIDCTKEQMQEATVLIKGLLDQGQGLGHIFDEHWKEIPFSLRSCYRHIHNKDLDIAEIELPRCVRCKPRNHGDTREKPLDPEAMKGRTYQDFMALDGELRGRVVECDCVEGPAGSTDAILTLHFKALHFQIGIYLERKDTAHVVAALDWLHSIVGEHFSDIFGVLLCDRGTEFKDVAGMEFKDGKRRCCVYFTDPQRPDQKGSCEKNHSEIRRVIPKGTSLEGLDAFVLAEVFSHVNSYRRESIFWLSPMELAQKALPEELLDELGYRLVKADDVWLKPVLLERAIADRKSSTTKTR
jgi:IS30 family transposase